MPRSINLTFHDCRRDDGAAVESVRLVGALVDDLTKLAAQAATSDDYDARLARRLDALAELNAPVDYEHDETDGWDDANEVAGCLTIRCVGRFDRFNESER